MFCSNCGYEITGVGKFCSNCGTPVLVDTVNDDDFFIKMELGQLVKVTELH